MATEKQADGQPEQSAGGTIAIEACGVRFDLPKRRLDDFRLLRAMRDMQRAQKKGGQPEATILVDLMEIVCGEDFDRICDELADEDGVVPNERIAEFFNETFSQANLKN